MRACIPRLTPEEREEVRLRLAELDHDAWLDDGALTAAEKALIEERLRNVPAGDVTFVRRFPASYAKPLVQRSVGCWSAKPTRRPLL